MTTPRLDKLETFFTEILAENKAEELKRQRRIEESFHENLTKCTGDDRDLRVGLSFAQLHELKAMYLDFSSQLARIRTNQDVQIAFMREILRLMEQNSATAPASPISNESAELHGKRG